MESVKAASTGVASKVRFVDVTFTSVLSDILPIDISLFAIYVCAPFDIPSTSFDPSSKTISKAASEK